MSLISLLVAVQAFACPSGAPTGFSLTPDKNERAYANAQKTIQVVVKCDESATSQQSVDALAMLGERHAVSDSISYVDMKNGVMRIYVAKQAKGVAQMAVVAKTPEALAKAAPALVDYLKK